MNEKDTLWIHMKYGEMPFQTVLPQATQCYSGTHVWMPPIQTMSQHKRHAPECHPGHGRRQQALVQQSAASEGVNKLWKGIWKCTCMGRAKSTPSRKRWETKSTCNQNSRDRGNPFSNVMCMSHIYTEDAEFSHNLPRPSSIVWPETKFSSSGQARSEGKDP
eukprot:835347-Amphidinium_carterae.1